MEGKRRNVDYSTCVIDLVSDVSISQYVKPRNSSKTETINENSSPAFIQTDSYYQPPPTMSKGTQADRYYNDRLQFSQI